MQPTAHKVLYVEDEADIAAGVRMRLQSAGYECLLARSGDEGISTAILHQPNAILLDVRIPDIDGVRLIRELRARAETRHIPIVVLSASLLAQNAALDAGARFYLGKPCDGTKLIQTLDYAIRESHQEHAACCSPQRR